MAKQQKQATEEYKTPILSAIYKVFGFLTIGAGLLMFFVGFADAAPVLFGQGFILVFAGISLFGIAQVITFIGEIAVNTRITALNSAILAANASGQVDYAKDNEEIVLS